MTQIVPALSQAFELEQTLLLWVQGVNFNPNPEQRYPQAIVLTYKVGPPPSGCSWSCHCPFGYGRDRLDITSIIPHCAAFRFQEEGGRPPLDWWGINYYARGIISAYFTPASMPGEQMTDMGYSVYPEGMYENIVRGSQLGVPM